MADNGSRVFLPASMFAALQRAQRSTRQMGIPTNHPLNAALQRCMALPGSISLAPTAEDLKINQLVDVVPIEGKIGSDTCCPVCLEPFGQTSCVKTRCCHAFHKSCVESWIDHQYEARNRRREPLEANCPVCRAIL